MQEFWKFVRHDWYFAIPMFCMSFVAVTMVVWPSIMVNGAAVTRLPSRTYMRVGSLPPEARVRSRMSRLSPAVASMSGSFCQLMVSMKCPVMPP